MSAEAGELAYVETLLSRAARALEYPATPAIAATVASRLSANGRHVSLLDNVMSRLREGWYGVPGRALAAGLGAAVLALGVVLAIPQSRTALADLFRLSNVRVEVEPTPTGVPPTPLPTIRPEEVAQKVSLGEARGAVDFPLRLPTRDGASLEPDGVYLLGEGIPAPAVVLIYADERFDLYETRRVYFGKGVPDDEFVQRVKVNGREALWLLPGHTAYFEDPDVPELRRTVDQGVLFWQENGVTYRLETALSRDEAIEIAESLD